ncbi:MAG: prephenate dehydratase [Bacillota bacterium]
MEAIVDGVRKVAYQGEPGAFSESAAAKMEPGAQLLPCRTLSEAFKVVALGRADAAVVPVENSLAGSIGETYDLLLTHNLVVTGEVILPVNHCLMALPGVSLSQIRKVVSHPQALAQCNDFLEQLAVECVPFYDTAGAARHVRETGATDTAAVASRHAADIYRLQVLIENIQSYRDNFTRFYRIERELRPAGIKNKSVFVVSLPHHPGSLFMALASFACRGINLTKIESRPVKKDPWQYVFFLEFEGHINDWAVKQAIDELQAKSSMLKVLGSFSVEE